MSYEGSAGNPHKEQPSPAVSEIHADTPHNAQGQPETATHEAETTVPITQARSSDITAAPGVLQALRGATDMLCRTFVTETDLTVQSVPPVKFATADALVVAEVADNERQMSVSSPGLCNDSKDQKVCSTLDCGCGEHISHAEPGDVGDTKARAVLGNAHCILAYPMYQTRTRRPPVELGYYSGPFPVAVSDNSGAADEIDVQYRRPKTKHRSRPRHRKYKKPSSYRGHGYTSNPQEYNALNRAVDNLIEQLEQPERLDQEYGYPSTVDAYYPPIEPSRAVHASQDDLERVRTACDLLQTVTETIMDDGRFGQAEPIVVDLRDHSYDRNDDRRPTPRSPARKKRMATVPTHRRIPSTPSTEDKRPGRRIAKEWVLRNQPDVRQAGARGSSGLDLSAVPDGTILTVRRSETLSPGRKKEKVKRQEATLLWSTKARTNPASYAVESSEREGGNVMRKGEGNEGCETSQEIRPKPGTAVAKKTTNRSPQGRQFRKTAKSEEKEQKTGGEDGEEYETENEDEKSASQKAGKVSPQKRKGDKTHAGSEKEDSMVRVVVSATALLKNEVCCSQDLEDRPGIRRTVVNPIRELSVDIRGDDGFDRRRTGRLQVERPKEGSPRTTSPNERRTRDTSPERRSLERNARDATPTQAYKRPESDVRGKQPSREHRRSEESDFRERRSTSVQSRDTDRNFPASASAYSGEYVEGDFSVDKPSLNYGKRTDSDYRIKQQSLEHSRSIDCDSGRVPDHSRGFKARKSPLEQGRSVEVEYRGRKPLTFDYNRTTGSDSRRDELPSDYCPSDDCRYGRKGTRRGGLGNPAVDFSRSAPLEQWDERVAGVGSSRQEGWRGQDEEAISRGSPRDQWMGAYSTSRRARSSGQCAGAERPRNTQLSPQQRAVAMDPYRQQTSDLAVTYDRWRASSVGGRVLDQDRCQDGELRRRSSSRGRWVRDVDGAGRIPSQTYWDDVGKPRSNHPSPWQWNGVDSKLAQGVAPSDQRDGPLKAQENQPSRELWASVDSTFREKVPPSGQWTGAEQRTARELWRTGSIGDQNIARKQWTAQERQLKRRSSSRAKRIAGVDAALGRRVSYLDQWDYARRLPQEQSFYNQRVSADAGLGGRMSSCEQCIDMELRSMRPPYEKWEGVDVASRGKASSRDRWTGPQSIQPLPQQIPGGVDVFRQQTFDDVGRTGTIQPGDSQGGGLRRRSSSRRRGVGGANGMPESRALFFDTRIRQPRPEQRAGADGMVCGFAPSCDQRTGTQQPQGGHPASEQWAGVDDVLRGTAHSRDQWIGAEAVQDKQPSVRNFTCAVDPMRQRASENAIVYERWRASAPGGRNITQEQWRDQDGQLRKRSSSRDEWIGGVKNTLAELTPYREQWISAERPKPGELYPEQWKGVDAASRGRVPSRDQWTNTEGPRSRQLSPEQWVGVDIALKGRVSSRDGWTSTEGLQNKRPPPKQRVSADVALRGRVPSRDEWTSTEGLRSRQPSPKQRESVDVALRGRVPSHDQWTSTEGLRSRQPSPKQRESVEVTLRGRVPSRDEWTSTEGLRSRQPSPKQRESVEVALRGRVPSHDQWTDTEGLRSRQPSPKQRESVEVTLRGRVPSRDQWTSTEGLRSRQPSPKQRESVEVTLRGRVPSRDQWTSTEGLRSRQPSPKQHTGTDGSEVATVQLRSQSSSHDRVDATLRQRVSSGDQQVTSKWPRSKQPLDDRWVGAVDPLMVPRSGQVPLEGLRGQDGLGGKRTTRGRRRRQEGEMRSRSSSRDREEALGVTLTGGVSSRDIVVERHQVRQPSRVQWKDAEDPFGRQPSGEIWRDAVVDVRRREPSGRQWTDFELMYGGAKPSQEKLTGIDEQLHGGKPSQERWAVKREFAGQVVPRDRKRGRDRLKKKQLSREWMITGDTRQMGSRSDSSNLLPSAACTRRPSDLAPYPETQQIYAPGFPRRAGYRDDVHRRVASGSSITTLQVPRQANSYVDINCLRVHRAESSEALDRHVVKEMVPPAETERQVPRKIDSVEMKPEMDIRMQIARRADQKSKDSLRQMNATSLEYRKEYDDSKPHEITLRLYPEKEKPATVITERPRRDKRKAVERKDSDESKATKGSKETTDLKQETGTEGTKSPADVRRKSRRMSASPKTKKTAAKSPGHAVGDEGKSELDKKPLSKEQQPGQRINVWHIPKEDLDRCLATLSPERLERRESGSRQSMILRRSSSRGLSSPAVLASTLSSSRQTGSIQLCSKRSSSTTRGSSPRARKRSGSRLGRSRGSRQRGGHRTLEGEGRTYEVVRGPVVETGGVGFGVEEFRSKRMQRREREPNQSLSVEMVIEPKLPARASPDNASKMPRSPTPVKASPKMSPSPRGQRSPLPGQTTAASSKRESAGLYGVQQTIILPGPAGQQVLLHEPQRPHAMPSPLVHVIRPEGQTFVLPTIGGQTIVTQIPGQPIIPQGTGNLQVPFAPPMIPPAERHFAFPQGRTSPARNISPGPVPHTVIIQPPGEPQMQKYLQQEPKQEQRLMFQRDIRYHLPPRLMSPAFVMPIFTAQTTVTPSSPLSEQRQQQHTACPRSTWHRRKSIGPPAETTKEDLSNAAPMRSPRSAFSQPVFATCLEISDVVGTEPASEHTHTLTSTSAPVLDGAARVTAAISYSNSSDSDEDAVRSSPVSVWDVYPMDEWEKCNPMSTDPMIPQQVPPARNVAKSFRGFSNKRQSIIYFVLLIAAVASLAGAVSLYSKRKWPFVDDSFEGAETARMFAPLENVLDAGSLPRNVTKPCRGCSSEAPTTSKHRSPTSPNPGGGSLAEVARNQSGLVTVTST